VTDAHVPAAAVAGTAFATRASWQDLPMFFDAPHRALGEELAAAVPSREADLERAAPAARAMGSLGLYALLVPSASGGRAIDPSRPAAIDVRALCIAREALGYTSPLADSIFAVQGLGSHPVVLTAPGGGGREGSAERRDAFLAEVMRGDRIGAFALTEPEAGTDVASMRTTARREGDGWVLDGEKVFISNVGIADHFVVFASADPSLGKKGISAFVVPAGAPGLTLEEVPLSVDHPLGRLLLRGCKVPGSALLGEVGHGLRLALGTLDVFRTSVGAAAVGMARRALDESVRRVTTRVQFGQPLGDFQLTQAALADMVTDLDAARLLVFRAAWNKDHGVASPTDVAMAKMFATEAAQRVIDRAVQLHGGLGVALGSVVERLYREIRPLRIYEGTTEIQKLIIGSSLVNESKKSAKKAVVT
jgi:acyl-CoA dehydrogenase